MTHTYAILEVSKKTFEEIKKKLLRAGYGDQIDEKKEVIDMHGLALKEVPESPFNGLGEVVQ